MTRTRRRLLSGLAIAVTLFGLGLGLNSALALLRVEVGQIFYQLQLDMPGRSAPLSCPAAWASGDAGTISASLHNPTDKPMSYGVTFNVSISASGATPVQQFGVRTIIPAGQSADAASPDIRPSDAAYFEYVLLYAISDEDAGKQAWDMRSSYSATCTVRLMASSLNRQLMLLALVSPICALFGTAFWFYINRPLHGRRRIVLGLIGLAALIVECAAVFFIFSPTA